MSANNNSECADLQEYVHAEISDCYYVQFCMTGNTCGYLTDRDGRLDASTRTSAEPAAEPISERALAKTREPLLAEGDEN